MEQSQIEKMTNSPIRKRKREDHPSSNKKSLEINKKPHLISTERVRAFRQRQRERKMKENDTVISSIQNGHQHDTSEQLNIKPSTDFIIIHKRSLPTSTERVRAFRQRQRENQVKKNCTFISSIQNDRQHDNFEQSNIIPSTSANSTIVHKKPALTSTERSQAFRQRQRKRQMKENTTVNSSIQDSYQHDNFEQSNIIPRTSTDFVIFHKKPLPTSTERVRAFRQRQREKQPHSAMMEDGAGIRVKEMTIKTKVEEAAPSFGHVDIEIDTNRITEEPNQLVRNKPALLVKEEILEDSRQDGHEQRRVQGALSSAIIGSVNDACSMRFGEVRNIKDELTDIDIGPTVLQHFDIHYRINKNTGVTEENIIVDDCNKPMPCNRVKKECLEDKLSDRDEVYRSKWFGYKAFQCLMDNKKRLTLNTAQKINNFYEQNAELDATEEIVDEHTKQEITIQDEAFGGTEVDILEANIQHTTQETSTNINLQTTATRQRHFVPPKAKKQKPEIKSDPRINKTFDKVQTCSKRDACEVYGEHIAMKLRSYSKQTQSVVQHIFSNILFNADMGQYDISMNASIANFGSDNAWTASRTSTHCTQPLSPYSSETCSPQSAYSNNVNQNTDICIAPDVSSTQSKKLPLNETSTAVSLNTKIPLFPRSPH